MLGKGVVGEVVPLLGSHRYGVELRSKEWVCREWSLAVVGAYALALVTAEYPAVQRGFFALARALYRGAGDTA